MGERAGITRAAIFASIALLCVAVSPEALGSDAPHFGPNDVPTVFYIAKSENRNRVDFGIRLDSNCQPRGNEPVFPYWRMLEESPSTLEGLSRGEPRAYGIAEQRVHDRSRHGTWVRVVLRAVPSRPIEVLALRNSSGRCTAGARMQIRGREAHLGHVYVQLGRGLIPRPRWIRLEGRTVREEHPVRERIDD
jgi:hypothetical protein